MGMTGGAKNLAEILDALGEKANAAGLQLLYHNHDFEFMKDKDGNVPIDYLLENGNPDFVNFQMDLYWVIKAGAAPLAYFEKYPGRFKIWHVKDTAENGNFAPVGNGTIDFARILAQKDRSGMKYYFVEQDKTFTIEPLEAIKVSHKEYGKLGSNKTGKGQKLISFATIKIILGLGTIFKSIQSFFSSCRTGRPLYR